MLAPDREGRQITFSVYRGIQLNKIFMGKCVLYLFLFVLFNLKTIKFTSGVGGIINIYVSPQCINLN